MDRADLISRAQGAMLGVAVGDALGATLEFMSPNEIKQRYGVLKDIIGGGHWQLNPGEVTDDTDMTIALAKGIIADRHNPLPQIAREFVEWVKTEPKDIGHICRLVLTDALQNGLTHEAQWYQAAERGHVLNGARSAGNGSLMRTVPVVLAYLPDRETMLTLARKQSALTHFDRIAAECTAFYCELVRKVMLGQDLKTVIRTCTAHSPLLLQFDLKPDAIKTSGYVLHTLEAAINCAYQTSSLEEAVIMAVNLGGDTDTIGAVTGGLAGAHYGVEKIPQRWLDTLTVYDEILALTAELLHE